ncbi:hypothetical protein B0I37DRAFT_376982 [Chaetomium sp. MPI-CAGE-AT-0009]|nr:hypothetical protein B0I37DRAFT_376982 [Chaetomium sp. MPI-CAGE-AT-0009]
MKFTTLIALATTCASGVLAGPGSPVSPRYPSVCGHWLVNTGSKTQSDIAKLRCGRTDTCNGEEWNTVFHMSLRGEWYDGGFCSKGCYMYEEGGMQLGACH